MVTKISTTVEIYKLFNFKVVFTINFETTKIFQNSNIKEPG